MKFSEASSMLYDGYSIRRESWQNQNAIVFRLGVIDITNIGTECNEWRPSVTDADANDWVVVKMLSDKEIKKAKCCYIKNKISLFYSGDFFMTLFTLICPFIKR